MCIILPTRRYTNKKTFKINDVNHTQSSNGTASSCLICPSVCLYFVELGSLKMLSFNNPPIYLAQGYIAEPNAFFTLISEL